MPSEMLLVDKKELKDILKNELNCILCGTNICPSSNTDYEDSNKTSFRNYCFNHFRCACCSSIFHARCFVYFRADIFTTCPNLYCSSMYSLSEMERFFGQLLLSYAYNNEPIKEFINLYDEYKLQMFKKSDVSGGQSNSKLGPFASLASIQDTISRQSEVTKIIENIFMDILINGKMALVLMDDFIWDRLADYLFMQINYPHSRKEYIQRLLDGDARKVTPKKRKADKQPIFSPSDKLYHILLMARAMRDIKDKKYYLDVYLKYVEKIDFPEISELRATYFFAYLFQEPGALLVIENAITTYRSITKDQDDSLGISSAALIEKFMKHYHEALIRSNEAVFRKLYMDYITVESKEGSLNIELCLNKEDYTSMYLVKMQVRMTLGTGCEPAAYSTSHSSFMFRWLINYCLQSKIILSAGEICGLLIRLNANNAHFTQEDRICSAYVLQKLLETSFPSEAVKIFQYTLINNYSLYLGKIYAVYIPHMFLKEICNREIRQKFNKKEHADEFQEKLTYYKGIDI